MASSRRPEHPPAVLDRLSREVKRITPDRAVQERLTHEGLASIHMTRAAFAAKIANGISKWRKVAKAAGVKLQ